MTEKCKTNISKIGLLSGYTFFILMIFAKAIGLDSSNKVYYIFAAIAVVFWCIEVLFYKFNMKQFVISGILMIIALATVVVTHKPGFVLTMMAIVALRNMDREKMIIIYLYSWVVGLIVIAGLVSVGIVEDITMTDARGYFRHAAGFCTGNCYHSAFVILFGLYFYFRKCKVNWWEVVIAECLNVAVFHFSGSYTGLVIGMMIPVTMYVLSKLDDYIKNSGKFMLCNVYAGGLCFLMLIVVIVSFAWPMISKDYIRGGQFMTFISRIYLSYTAMRDYPITLFGFKDINIMLDNAYVYIFYQFGVIPFITVIGLYTTAIVSLIKKKDVYALTLIAIFVAYGFMEQFFNAAFMNFTWIIVGCEVMNEVVPRIGSKVKDKKQFD